jgi:hypothetical protein
MTKSRKTVRYARNMPWYRSRVIVGALVAAFATILERTGLVRDIAPNDLAVWTDFALTLLGVIGAGMTVQGRLTQDIAPRITLKDRT